MIVEYPAYLKVIFDLCIIALERDQDIFFEIVNSNSDASTNTSVENEDSQELNLIQNELISFDNQSSKANQVCSQDRAESDIDEALQQIIPVDKLESAMNEKRIKGNYGFKKEYAVSKSIIKEDCQFHSLILHIHIIHSQSLNRLVIFNAFN